MTKDFIIALDQGTTSSRTIAFDIDGKSVVSSQQDFEQIFPDNGWVEHNPKAIWESQLKTIQKVFSNDGATMARTDF